MVTLTGTNFVAPVTVSFGGINATNVAVVNATSVTCDAPPHINGAVNVTVTTSGGTSNAVSFTYQAAPVTDRAIDGGPSFYASNGFTYAAAAGWDNPSFFPVGFWLSSILDQQYVNRWLDLGINTAFGLTADSTLSLLRTNGIWAVMQYGDFGRVGAPGAETVGLFPADEPSSYSAVTGPISTTAANIQHQRFWWLNVLHEALIAGTLTGSGGDIGLAAALDTPIQTPDGPRVINITGTDWYWMASARDPNLGGTAGRHYQRPAFTEAQTRRSQHYGYHVDRMRYYTTRDMPLLQFVENGGPYNGQTDGSSYIQPPELNAAVWNSIIHGARAICYFDSSFSGPAPSNGNLVHAVPYYSTVQPGQTESIYSQTKKTNTLVKQLASVINSPFADGVVTVSPAPPQISFSGTNVSIVGDLFSGIDYAVKRHVLDGKLYVLSSNRGAGATDATFAVSGVPTGTATVINEGRTQPIVGGQFSDTFATKDTVHIYRID